MAKVVKKKKMQIKWLKFKKKIKLKTDIAKIERFYACYVNINANIDSLLN